MIEFVIGHGDGHDHGDDGGDGVDDDSYATSHNDEDFFLFSTIDTASPLCLCQLVIDKKWRKRRTAWRQTRSACGWTTKGQQPAACG